MIGTMFWVMPIQIMLESYLILVFASFCNLLRPYIETSGQQIELALAGIFFIATMGFPLISAYFMYANFDTLGEYQMKIRYHPMYAELDLKKKWSAIAFRVSFLLRRIVIISALLLTDQLWLQISMAFIQEITVMIILGWMQPYEEASKWRRELLNEWFITITIYHVMCFTETNSVEMRIFMGYSFCFSLSVHVLGNIGFIMFMSIKSAIWGVKKALIVKKELKRVARIRDEDSITRQRRAKRYLKRRGDFVLLDVYENHDSAQKFRLNKNVQKIGLGLMKVMNINMKEPTYFHNPMYEPDAYIDPTDPSLKKRLDRQQTRLGRLQGFMTTASKGFAKKKATKIIAKVVNRKRIELVVEATHSSSEESQGEQESRELSAISALSSERSKTPSPKLTESDTKPTSLRPHLQPLSRNAYSKHEQMGPTFGRRNDSASTMLVDLESLEEPDGDVIPDHEAKIVENVLDPFNREKSDTKLV